MYNVFIPEVIEKHHINLFPGMITSDSQAG